MEVKIGDKIKIIRMEGEPQYTGKIGEVTNIDGIGQLHGTWGGCGVLVDVDEFEILEKDEEEKVDEETLKKFCDESSKKYDKIYKELS